MFKNETLIDLYDTMLDCCGNCTFWEETVDMGTECACQTNKVDGKAWWGEFTRKWSEHCSNHNRKNK